MLILLLTIWRCADAGAGDLDTREFSVWSKVEFAQHRGSCQTLRNVDGDQRCDVQICGTWETSVGMDPKTREEMGWPAEFEDWNSMQSTALAKRLRAQDIMAQTDSMVANGCFQKNMLKVLKIKEADMVRPTKQQQPLSPEKWEGTINCALEKGQH